MEWTTGKVKSNEPDDKKVIQQINRAVAAKITYNPGISSYTGNPLNILAGENSGSAVCWDNALILQGLLKNIGFTSTEIEYQWGGKPDTGIRHYYCPSDGCDMPTTQHPLGNRVTMQTKRDRLDCLIADFGECVRKDPEFTYHAIISYGGNFFDPSYGIQVTDFSLLTALKVEQGQSPKCVYHAEATALLVRKPLFGIDRLGSNVNPNKVCEPITDPFYSSAKAFRFDGFGGTDIAIARSSTGEWIIEDEDTNQIIMSPLSFDPNTDVLAPADYDGDGKTDFAVWRASTGDWWILKSSDLTYSTLHWGTNGDIPVQGDYDGDGTTDYAVVRPSTGMWYFLESENNYQYRSYQ